MAALPDTAPHGLDERQLRFERGLAAVLLLSGYVWDRDLVTALVAVAVTTAMITAWSIRPLGTIFEALIQPRLQPRANHLPNSTVRIDDLVVAVALLAATLLLFIGLVDLSRFIGLLIAGALMLEAAAGVWISGPIRERLRGRKQ